MSDTTIHNLDPANNGMNSNQTSSSADQATAASASAIVPTRQGSKYADILLQRLRSETIRPNQPSIIGFAGATGKQGVTTTATNLAIRAADHHIGPVLLIDANHRSPKATRMHRATGKGVSDCLTGRALLDECVKKTKHEGLHVLGLGQAKLAQQIVMGGPASDRFFEAVRERYQLVVVDLPVMNEPCIANAFLPQLDGVMLVGKYGMKKDLVKQLQQTITNYGGKVLGAVMTGQESKLPNWLSRWC
jgi:Mrp family chromosome partitioning ATPase